MNLQHLMPQQAQPIDRIPAGQLPASLAELTEEFLTNQNHSTGGILPSQSLFFASQGMCAYDDDTE